MEKMEKFFSETVSIVGDGAHKTSVIRVNDNYKFSISIPDNIPPSFRTDKKCMLSTACTNTSLTYYVCTYYIFKVAFS